MSLFDDINSLVSGELDPERALELADKLREWARQKQGDEPELEYYAGWTVVDVDETGGVLLQSPTGQRHRCWFQAAEIKRLELQIEILKEQSDG